MNMNLTLVRGSKSIDGASSYRPTSYRQTKTAFISSLVVVLILLIDPLVSFTPASRPRWVRSRRRTLSLPIPAFDRCCDVCKEAHSVSSFLMGQRSDREFNGANDDDYYYYDENEEKEVDYSTNYYGSSSYYEEDENNIEDLDGKYYQRDIEDRRESFDTTSKDNYYDDDDGDEETLNDDDENYNLDGRAEDRGGYYQVSFNEDVDPSETELDWEVCISSDPGDRKNGKSQALVLLPPAAVERPTAIIHFVGGTFFGSNPKLWYRSLLESIVRSTSVAIIVTPIPVTLFKNPLQHIRLSKKIQASFENAWYTVLEDEYGTDVLQDTPLCGLGHSLGSRLLTVLTTMNQNVPSDTTGSIPPYKSMCLISFTNYGAKVGIPGVAALGKQSRKRDQYSKNKGRARGLKSSSDNRYRDYDRYDDDPYLFDNESAADEEWAELVEEFQETVSEQANRIQTALTPDPKDLEFAPSPERLWKAIREDIRYNVNTTLVVQFDDDPIDQSSQLAEALHSTNSSDVRFARLRGNHLTPVSATDNNYDDDDGSRDARARRRLRRQTSAGKFGAMIEKTIKGNNKDRRDKIAMRDLRLSIVSYITDVVTK